MKTEMTTTGVSPIEIKWNPRVTVFKTKTISDYDLVAYSHSEAIELRDFLIQLNLGK